MYYISHYWRLLLRVKRRLDFLCSGGRSPTLSYLNQNICESQLSYLNIQTTVANLQGMTSEIFQYQYSSIIPLHEKNVINDGIKQFYILVWVFICIKNKISGKIKMIILGIFLILLLVAVYKLYIVPRSIWKNYQTQIAKTSYKPLVRPFNILYNGINGQPLKGKKNGDPYRVYREQYPHADIVISNVFHRPVIEFLHVDFIKDFFANDKHYDYPKIHLFMSPFKRMYGNMSIGMSEGEQWKQRRANINKIFNFDFVKLQIPNIARITDRCIHEMEATNEIKQTPEGKVIQVDIYNELSLHIFSQALFYLSLALKERHELEGVQISEYMAETVKLISNNQIGSPTALLGDWFYNMEFRKIDKEINRRIKLLKAWGYKTIAEKLKEAEVEMNKNPKEFVGDNIIKAIHAFKLNNNLTDDNPFVSVEYLFSQICGLFVAGTDTTSNFWNLTINYLGKYPEVEAKVREEVETYMKVDDYSYDNLSKFKYIDALQKQVTRVYGPANIAFPRVAIRDNYINGLAVKAGTAVLVNPIGNEHSETYFKQPYEFRPERWINGETDNLPPYVVLGFHAGARTCIGKQFALIESKIALIKFIKKYKKIILPNKDFKMAYNLTLCAERFKTKLVLADE